MTVIHYKGGDVLLLRLNTMKKELRLWVNKIHCCDFTNMIFETNDKLYPTLYVGALFQTVYLFSMNRSLIIPQIFNLSMKNKKNMQKKKTTILFKYIFIGARISHEKNDTVSVCCYLFEKQCAIISNENYVITSFTSMIGQSMRRFTKMWQT